MDISEIQKKIDELNLSEKEVRKEAGVAFRNIREQETGRTQEAIVAELLESHYPSVTTRTISRWEKNGIPLENIPLLAKCLGRPLHDFLPLLFSEQQDVSRTMATQTVLQEFSVSDVPDSLWKNWFSKRHYGKTLAITSIVMVSFIWSVFIANRSEIEIIWPSHRIETHQVEVMGKLNGWYFRSHQEIDIQLFVHPIDGSNKYWLNSRDFAIVNEDGSWYQQCRFGDEDYRSMKTPPPLDFEVFAVALRKGVEFPIKEGKNHIIAMNKSDFIRQMEPYAEAVSTKFAITRVKPVDPVQPMVISLKSPLRITWQEQVPMYLQIYHGGEIYREGYYHSDDSIDLPPSAIIYEVKMSREKDYPQQSQWVMVETPTF